MTATRSRPRFDPSLNLYRVLDVPMTASQAEITRAYRTLVRLTHPDTMQDVTARAKAEERTRLLNAAWDVLSKPDVRREYDQTLRNSAINDVLMDRYSGGASASARMGQGQAGTSRPKPKPPSARVIRAQRNAYRSAVGQLLLIVVAFTGLLLVVGLVLGTLSRL